MATISGVAEYKLASHLLAIRTVAARPMDIKAESFIPIKTMRLACCGWPAPSQKETRALQAMAMDSGIMYSTAATLAAIW